MRYRIIPILGVLVLAACAPAVTAPPTAPPSGPTAASATGVPAIPTTVPVATSTSAPAPTVSPTSATQTSDPWGVVTVKNGSKIRVAVTALSTTRPGQDLLQGAKMAAADFGKDIAPGFDLELVTFEDTSVAEKILQDPQIVGVIGTASGDTMIPQSVILDKAHLVMISPAASADVVTTRGLETVNRTIVNEAVYAVANADYLWSQKHVKTVAVVYQDTLYGQRYSQVFRDEFVKAGGTVVALEAVSPAISDFSATLTKIATAKPQLLLSVGGADDFHKGIAVQKNPAGLKDSLLMLVGIQSSDDFLSIGSVSEGVLLAGSGRVTAGAAEDEFFRKYLALGGKRGTVMFAHYAYDAVGIMVQALKSVAVVNRRGELEIGRQALARTVRATKGYAGATGDLTFDQNGDRIPIGALINVYVVQKGRFILP